MLVKDFECVLINLGEEICNCIDDLTSKLPEVKRNVEVLDKFRQFLIFIQEQLDAFDVLPLELIASTDIF